MTPAATDSEFDTLADKLRDLGDIPPERVLWRPYPGTATEADVLRLVDGEPKRLVELVDGILVEKAMGYREGLLAAFLIHHLLNFVRPRKLGLVGAPDSIMRLEARLLRLPDVHFVAWSSLPAEGAHDRPVADFPPDLAVEIVSAGNTRREIDRKRREYFAAGASAVWVIDPRTRTAEVYQHPDRPNEMTLVREPDELDGGSVLLGFRLRLADRFADLDPPPPAG